MKWFKFYGQDYISDPKMLALSPCERSCWITLLCYSSINDNGMITFLSEQQLMTQAGLDFQSDEWEQTKGVLEKLKNLKMIQLDNDKITILNWQKRQQTNLSPYERVKRYREKKLNDNVNDNVKVTLDKKRRDKRESNPHASVKWLEEIPATDLSGLYLKYRADRKEIQHKAGALLNWMKSKGVVKKNYRAFLEIALEKDFGRRTPEDIRLKVIKTHVVEGRVVEEPIESAVALAKKWGLKY